MRQCSKTGFYRNGDGIPRDTGVCQGILRDTPRSVRSSHTAEINRTWREDARNRRAVQRARDQAARNMRERQERCDRAEREERRMMDIYRDSRSIKRKRWANRRAWALRDYIRGGSPGPIAG